MSPQPQVPYDTFCDRQEELEEELGPEADRLYVDRSPTACEHAWSCVALFPSGADRSRLGRF